MNFGEALEILKNGGKVARDGWNGAGQFIELQVPTKESKMGLPFLYISTVSGALVPWVASHTDILSDDWVGIQSRI